MSQVIELHFPIQGKRIPSDHGYLLFSAISQMNAEIHDVDYLGIHTFPGVRVGNGFIKLLSDSKLKLRLPVDKIASVYKLAGKRLRLGGDSLLLGSPSIVALTPASKLWARIVVIKTKDESRTPECILVAANKQLDALEINGKATLERVGNGPEEQYARRVVKIKGTTIPGFGLYVNDLSDEDSIRLQSEGIGGRRKMGCGLFVPALS